MYLQMKQIAKDIPVARRGGSASVSTGVHFGPQSVAVVALLRIFLPTVSGKDLVRAITSLCHRAPVAQVSSAMEECGNETTCKRAIEQLRKWHITHRAESQLGHVVNALEKMGDGIENCASLRDVVVVAKRLVSLLGVAAAPDTSGDNFSQSSSPQPASQVHANAFESGLGARWEAGDGFSELLAAAEQVESEAIRLLDDEALRAANEAAVKDEAAGENEGPADAEYFAQLLSHDVRARTNVQRKKRGCGSTTDLWRNGPGADTSGGARAAKAKARGEMLAIFVARAQEMITQAESKESEARFPSKDDRVRFITVHKSKGQEWPYVFVAGCNSNNFPVEGLAQCEAATSGAHLREERRIFFVAATRAQVQATFTYSRRARWAAAPSPSVYDGESPFLAEGRACRRDAPDDVIVESVSGDVEDPTVADVDNRGGPEKQESGFADAEPAAPSSGQ